MGDIHHEDKCRWWDDETFCDYGAIEVDRLQKELAETRAELEKVEETAIANVRAEVANGGTSCHWCLDIAIRKERERCRFIADRIGFAAVNRKDAQSCCAEIAAAIESGE